MYDQLKNGKPAIEGVVTPCGRALIERIEKAVQDYTATLTPLPLPELTRKLP